MPLLAVLVAAATTAGIQVVLPLRGPWVPVVAAAGGVAVASTLLLWQHVTRRQLEVFDGWFRYVVPGRTLIAHWDDVIEAFSPTSRRRHLLGRHEYIVVLGGGITLRLGSEIGADADLGDEIEARTRGVVAARTAAHIASGRRVAFGPIGVTKDGITVKGIRTRSIPFDRIRDQRLQGRHYLLRSLDNHHTSAIRVSRIPSPGALFDVVEQGRQKASAKPIPAWKAA
jgi:hypothetical protein